MTPEDFPMAATVLPARCALGVTSTVHDAAVARATVAPGTMTSSQGEPKTEQVKAIERKIMPVRIPKTQERWSPSLPGRCYRKQTLCSLRHIRFTALALGTTFEIVFGQVCNKHLVAEDRQNLDSTE